MENTQMQPLCGKLLTNFVYFHSFQPSTVSSAEVMSENGTKLKLSEGSMLALLSLAPPLSLFRDAGLIYESSDQMQLRGGLVFPVVCQNCFVKQATVLHNIKQ
ncbi:hypothetical protein CRENBAI_017382 [Crenichthys baileyi]|uniref:Uncharacterized protein n=1 Tax=Crenichthys baileyi TaxID=28760 RepID=A0AAV9RXE0_9TELE